MINRLLFLTLLAPCFIFGADSKSIEYYLKDCFITTPDPHKDSFINMSTSSLRTSKDEPTTHTLILRDKKHNPIVKLTKDNIYLGISDTPINFTQLEEQNQTTSLDPPSSPILSFFSEMFRAPKETSIKSLRFCILPLTTTNIETLTDSLFDHNVYEIQTLKNMNDVAKVLSTKKDKKQTLIIDLALWIIHRNKR